MPTPKGQPAETDHPSSDPRQRCVERLQELLAMPAHQRWATQVVDAQGIPTYPHEKAKTKTGKFHTPLQAKYVEAHVQGRRTIGLLSDGHGSTCKFGAIDLDTPRDGETLQAALSLVASLQAAASERGLNTFCTFSGGRGFHLVLPLAFPTPWTVVHRALRRVARDVGYEPAELFPTAGKCLKLPCGVHGSTGAWSVVLPNLSEWREDQLSALGADIEQGLAAAKAGQPHQPNWDQQAALLEAVRFCDPQALEQAAGESTVPDLELLPVGEHPQCITALLTQGPRPEQDLNHENLNLARYCAQRGLEDAEALELAEKLWEQTPEGYSKKTLEASLKNFQQSFTRSQEQDSTYLFRCSDMAAGGPEQARKLVALGRCQGEACPCWPWGPGRPETGRDVSGSKAHHSRPHQGSDRKAKFSTPSEGGDEDLGQRHGRTLWRALQAVYTEGLELRLSLVLAAAERLPTDPHPNRDPQEVTQADVLAERELLASVLDPASAEAVMKAAALLSPAAFNACSTEPWDAWASSLAAVGGVLDDTWRAHLERLSDTALRVQAEALGSQLIEDSYKPAIGPADALVQAANAVAQLQRTATPDLAPAEDHLESLLTDLLNPAPPQIPVSHAGLRKVLGGGFRQGQLVAAGGPPGSGKTTWALQVADEAAAAGVPVLFLSMEMTRTQLMQASLSRLSEIDGRDLAKGLAAGSSEARRLNAVVPTYQKLSERLYLVEGGQQHTPGRLQALVGQIRHQQELPPDAPLLVVCDYLQLMALGAEGEGTMPETLRVGALATSLKQLARSAQCTVIALSDVTKEAMREAESGGRIGPGVFRDSARVLHACDTALVVQSGTLPGNKSRPEQNLLEAALQEPLPEDRRKLLEGGLRQLVHPGDTYSRLTVMKNRGGQSGGDVWSIYRRHLSQYLPCLPGEANPDDLKALEKLGGRRGF